MEKKKWIAEKEKRTSESFQEKKSSQIFSFKLGGGVLTFF